MQAINIIKKVYKEVDMKNINAKIIMYALAFLVYNAEHASQGLFEGSLVEEFEIPAVHNFEEVVKEVTPVYLRAPFSGKKVPFNCAVMGYVKNEAFFDSRRVYGLRQDQYIAFPREPLLDRCGRDINAKGTFNMLAIETRFRLELQGPNIFGVPLFAATEWDFWGFARSEDFGSMRMRHAFLYFHWPEKSLLLGTYWHPILVPECYPNMVGDNAGVPIECSAREPQVRFTKYFDNITVILAAIARVTAMVYGPGTVPNVDIPAINSRYTRNAVMPNLHAQAQANLDNKIVGIGVDVTRFVPRLVTNSNYITKDSFFSWLALIFAVARWDNVMLKTKFIYAQNGSGYGLISGYGVHAINPYNDQRTYTNTQSLSAWVDLEYKTLVEPGIFLGFTKNIGSPKTIIPQVPFKNIIEPTIYATNSSKLDYVFRVSPRVRWLNGPFVFGAELDYMHASYGQINTRGLIYDKTPVNNVRVLFATYYYF